MYDDDDDDDVCARHCVVSDTPLLCQPFTKTDLARRGFRYSVPAVWNSITSTVLEIPSITVFKSSLKLICLIWLMSNSNDVTCATTASEVTIYDGIEYVYYYYYLVSFLLTYLCTTRLRYKC